MIQATNTLLQYLQSTEQKDGSVIQSYVQAILKLGSKEDAKQLLDSFLENYSDFNHGYLLDIFRKHGDESFAEKIFEKTILNGELQEDVDTAVLTVLGDLNYAPVKEIVYKYALSGITNDYSLMRASALGLLNFDCSEYTHAIQSAIENCLNKNLFPEFIPALVCKLPQPEPLLESLYQSGTEIASTDCNAGMLLGFSLCGEKGKEYFKEALFSPAWQAYSGSTGTLYFAYQGLINLKISFKDLYADITQLPEKKAISDGLTLLFNLFDCRIRDYENEGLESFRDLYQTFFRMQYPPHPNDLLELASSIDMEDEAYRYRNLFQIKMTEEILIENGKN